MVQTKWYGQNGMDKMSRTEWYGQIVAIFGIYYSSSEFNTYSVTKSHTQVINTIRKYKGAKVKAGLMKKLYCQWERLIDDFIGRPTILSIPFCLYQFVQYHFVLEPYYAVKKLDA